jgi:hypothetical protein
MRHTDDGDGPPADDVQEAIPAHQDPAHPRAAISLDNRTRPGKLGKLVRLDE